MKQDKYCSAFMEQFRFYASLSEFATIKRGQIIHFKTALKKSQVEGEKAVENWELSVQNG